MLAFHPCFFLFVFSFLALNFLPCLIRRKAYYLNEIDIVEVMLSTETTCISSVSLIHELMLVASFILGPCHDEHPDCDTFVMNGMCDQSIPFKEIFNVRELCKQSCGVCNRYVFLEILE